VERNLNYLASEIQLNDPNSSRTRSFLRFSESLDIFCACGAPSCKATQNATAKCEMKTHSRSMHAVAFERDGSMGAKDDFPLAPCAQFELARFVLSSDFRIISDSLNVPSSLVCLSEYFQNV
jgi:hypothetical protein